jgi:hypothetical protein
MIVFAGGDFPAILMVGGEEEEEKRNWRQVLYARP